MSLEGQNQEKKKERKKKTHTGKLDQGIKMRRKTTQLRLIGLGHRHKPRNLSPLDQRLDFFQAISLNFNYV